MRDKHNNIILPDFARKEGFLWGYTADLDNYAAELEECCEDLLEENGRLKNRIKQLKMKLQEQQKGGNDLYMRDASIMGEEYQKLWLLHGREKGMALCRIGELEGQLRGKDAEIAYLQDMLSMYQRAASSPSGEKPTGMRDNKTGQFVSAGGVDRAEESFKMWLQGCSFFEIANALGIKEASVRRYVSAKKQGWSEEGLENLRRSYQSQTGREDEELG